jgi:hypothetical protein
MQHLRNHLRLFRNILEIFSLTITLPSGKRLHNYGQITMLLMGKLTISMAIFHSFLLVITRGYLHSSTEHELHQGTSLGHGMRQLRQAGGRRPGAREEARGIDLGIE